MLGTYFLFVVSFGNILTKTRFRVVLIAVLNEGSLS